MLHLTNDPSAASALRSQIAKASILPRIWAHDHTVWKDDPIEIGNRLGWLHLPETMPKQLAEIDRFASSVRDDRFRHVLLLGMGGSSLAPETFALTFGAAQDHPDLTVLDSTHPDAVRAVERRLDLARTLFIVATKSGTTAETLSFFRYFHGQAARACGDDAPGDRFVAITDPGSPLVSLARRHRFRAIFENDPNLGGRYAALSHFGLVPAALLGIDVAELLARSQRTARACAVAQDPDVNPAARLGTFLGASARAGRDKATFVVSDGIASFGNWVEQLIAESTGKEGAGILPVVDEPIGPPTAYRDDRLFVHLCADNDASDDDAVAALGVAGHPVARIDVPDRLEIGGEFFLWELATAIVGHALRTNPFDQPNVESAKAATREMVDAYRETGALPDVPTAAPTPDGVGAFLDRGGPGDYVALHAYLPPTQAIADGLRALRAAIRDRLHLATTVGFGPRFLHSTGQLHKGDRGNGLFLQLLADPAGDIPIPDEAGGDTSTLTFGALLAAQAGGDRRALTDAGRRVLTLRLDRDGTIEQIQHLAGGIS